jgi:hypothetical protein
MTEAKPLSALVAQGWEIVGYAGSSDPSNGMHNNSVLLRRQKQHKILRIRNKWLGKGLVVTEIDL